MRKSDEIRRDQELAEQARPIILGALRDGVEPLEITRLVTAELAIDEQQAYRWVSYTAEAFDRRRRRIVAAGLALLWAGVFGVVAGVMVTLFADSRPLAWVAGLAPGLPVAAAGLLIARRAPRMVRDAL